MEADGGLQYSELFAAELYSSPDVFSPFSHIFLL